MAEEGRGLTANTVSGGTFNGPVVQGRYITVIAAAVPLALAQLPPRPAGFVGRDGELAALAELLDPSARTGTPVISAAGLAGVGKTALAVAAGHGAQERGWYPGGVLFIDLHGYDEGAAAAAQVLDVLLRTLGAPGVQIPPGTDSRAALYRSMLAQRTEPVLIIADNASSEAQVRPLLPGVPQHRVVVTSRETLAGLDARLVEVGVLGGTASAELLDAALRLARPADDRISSDPQAAAELADACGGLPLALQIAAALLKTDPGLTAAGLAAELASERDRLARLRYDDGSGPDGLSVAAAFELSYRRLSPDMALLLRLLTLDPGPDVSVAAAAALAGVPPQDARGLLAGLAKAHLIEADSPAPGRWRMHDLLHLYARQRRDEDTDAAVCEQARDRLLGYYLAGAQAASEHVEGMTGTTPSPLFVDPARALAWLDAEQPNLIAAVTMAAEAGRDRVAMQLPPALGEYLEWRRRLDDKLIVATISRDSARRLGDRRGEAVALNMLGNSLAQVQRVDEAIDTLRDAVAIFRELKDRQGEGMALGNLGPTLAGAGQLEKAITESQNAADIFGEVGDPQREAISLVNLSYYHRAQGRPADALRVSEKAMRTFRQASDRRREGMALIGLGVALRELRQLLRAIGVLQESATILAGVGDPHHQGRALDELARTFQEDRRTPEAISTYRDAACAHAAAGDPAAAGASHFNIGQVLLGVRQLEQAVSAFQDAADSYQAAGDRKSEGLMLCMQAGTLAQIGHIDEARATAQRAETILREAGEHQVADITRTVFAMPVTSSE